MTTNTPHCPYSIDAPPAPLYVLQRQTRHAASDEPPATVYEVGYDDGSTEEVSSDTYHGILLEHRADIVYSECVGGRLVYASFEVLL